MAERRTSGGLWAQYNWCQIAIAPKQRSLLHERIAQRFDAMLAGGLIEEVAGLKARPDLPGLALHAGGGLSAGLAISGGRV